MTDPSYTAIMLLIDHSGSMASIQDDAEGGVNSFVVEQAKADGRRTVRIAEFSDEYELVHESRDAAAVPYYKLIPFRSTALLDAMGRAITEFGKELAALDEDARPGTVIFAVMTDGHENSSREYGWSQIKALVAHQEATYNWQILYLGANQDAIAVGQRMGVSAGHSMNYAASGIGTRAAYSTVSDYVGLASASAGPVEFTAEQREEVMQEDE
jgi:hypothetical protein